MVFFMPKQLNEAVQEILQLARKTEAEQGKNALPYAMDQVAHYKNLDDTLETQKWHKVANYINLSSSDGG